MPDPAPPPQWEALQRREVAHLLLGIAPALGFEDAMRKVIELERRGLFVVRAVPWPSEELVEAAIKAMANHGTPDSLGYSVVRYSSAGTE